MGPSHLADAGFGAFVGMLVSTHSSVFNALSSFAQFEAVPWFVSQKPPRPCLSRVWLRFFRLLRAIWRPVRNHALGYSHKDHMTRLLYRGACLALSFGLALGQTSTSGKPLITLDEFFNAVDIANVRISPDGRAVAIETTRADWEANRFRSDLWLYRDDGRPHAVDHVGPRQ